VTGRLDDESYARAALTYLAEPGDLRLSRLVRACGAARTLDAIKAGRFPAAAGHDADGLFGPDQVASPQPVAAAVATASGAVSGHGGASSSGGGGAASGGGAARAAAAQRAMRRWQVRLAELPTADDVAALCRAGIRLVCPGDPEWPVRLDDLADARPYALWLRGNADLRFSCLRSVAIVGSRAATAYGSYVASEFAASVAARGWAVISGGAYGVDAAAHRGALAADGVTVAVLACGVDVPYPAGHADLFDAVAAQGVVASEWPPGRTATRLRFLVRNRVIAALAAGTLVVEAGQRSGALNSARHARDLTRPLMAVPGPITSDLSAGCHTIIRDWQGMLVTSAADVIEYLSPVGTVDAPVQPATQRPGTGGRRAAAVIERDALDLEAAAVLDALPTRGGMGPAQIATRAGLDLDTVIGRLGALGAAGFAERCDQGWRLRRP
jgi:DNA processing protein